MGHGGSISSKSSKHTEWMWQSNPNPWLQSERAEWSHFSDLENLIIEAAFLKKKPKAMLDDYYIDFKKMVQVSNQDKNKQRTVKRVVSGQEEKHLREERFMDFPTDLKHAFGGQYGWVSPFIIETRRVMGLTPDQLPSKVKNIAPMIVAKAIEGIIQEGKEIGKLREAEHIGHLLEKQRNNGKKAIWSCCAYLYSLESFLYKNVNATMRLIGSAEHEHVWKRKAQTLGPFCLLLWDNPFKKTMTKNIKLYRGAQFTDDQIDSFKQMAKNPEEYQSFQAFTSCSRNRQRAENFGNTLLIMDVNFAFVADLSPMSQYPEEEEELITPGVCFRTRGVYFDPQINKNCINLELRQRWSCQDQDDLKTSENFPAGNDEYNPDNIFALYGDSRHFGRKISSLLLALHLS